MALVVCGLAVSGLLASACGSPSSSGPTAAQSGVRTEHATDLVGRRYCEILLVHHTPAGFTGDVYASYPLNDCPADRWSALDPAAIARSTGAVLAFRNGPRYWLMDAIAKVRHGAPVIRSFGGIAMAEEATVDIGPNLLAAQVPLTPHTVDRQAGFTFAAGRQVYELTSPSGTRWVMQSWSQAKDPTLAQADLAGLGPRLALPAGWTYTARTLQVPLVVATVTRSAHVLQDSLMDSYSEETGP